MLSTVKILNRPIIIVLAFAFAFIISSCSAPAEKLNQEGNQAFSEEAYLEALELYQSAQIESPELAEPYFNAANTFYRQGNFPAALEQMGMALQYIDEESLAESSFYNLGNTFYNSQDLAQAVEAYTQSLLVNPHDQDAKYNLELALQQQQQEQQEQQQQDQEQQEQSQSEEQNDPENKSGEGDESEDNQENQDSQNGDQQQEDPASEGDESQDQGEPDDEQQGDGSGQPQPGDEQQEEQDQPAQMPPPGQRMTEEQARQLLAALASEMETLQEHLGQYLFAQQAPPLQDW